MPTQKPRRRRSSKAPSPAGLASKTVELSIAAPQVVARRVAILSEAVLHPTRADHQEMLRMSTEKVAAFQQGWLAMWMQAWQAQATLVQNCWAWPMAWAQGPHAVLSATARPFKQTYGGVMNVLDAGLSPVHEAAVANARRLGKRER